MICLVQVLFFFKGAIIAVSITRELTWLGEKNMCML